MKLPQASGLDRAAAQGVLVLFLLLPGDSRRWRQAQGERQTARSRPLLRDGLSLCSVEESDRFLPIPVGNAEGLCTSGFIPMVRCWAKMVFPYAAS